MHARRPRNLVLVPPTERTVPMIVTDRGTRIEFEQATQRLVDIAIEITDLLSGDPDLENDEIAEDDDPLEDDDPHSVSGGDAEPSPGTLMTNCCTGKRLRKVTS